MSDPQFDVHALTGAVASLAELAEKSMRFAAQLADDVKRLGGDAERLTHDVRRLTARVTELELNQLDDEAAVSARHANGLHQRN